MNDGNMCFLSTHSRNVHISPRWLALRFLIAMDHSPMCVHHIILDLWRSNKSNSKQICCFFFGIIKHLLEIIFVLKCHRICWAKERKKNIWIQMIGSFFISIILVTECTWTVRSVHVCMSANANADTHFWMWCSMSAVKYTYMKERKKNQNKCCERASS